MLSDRDDPQSNSPSQVSASYGRRVKLRLANGDSVEARPKGKQMRLVCGDWVEAEQIDGENQWLVTKQHPRSNELARTNTRGQREALAANVNQVLVVIAGSPQPDRFMLDRLLGAAHLMHCDAAIVINKSDTDTLPEIATDYRSLGYTIVTCSAVSLNGLGELRDALSDCTSVLIGQSGVGKSSITNALVPEAHLRTATLGEKSQEGRHTTVAAHMLAVEPSGFLVDSPGVRDFAPHIDAAEDVVEAFPEFAVVGTTCRFHNCRHVSEPGCRVKELAEQNAVLSHRYKSYRRLLNITRQVQNKH